MKKLTILSGIIIVLNLQTVCGMESDTNDTDLLHLIAQDSNTNTTQNKPTKNNRFLCEHPGCYFASQYASQLNRHMQIHTGQKPFKCIHAGCNKAFTRENNLNQHILTHTGEKPFKCTYQECNQAFTQKSNLNTHIRVHTGEKPFECTHAGCNKAFTLKSNRDRHVKQKRLTPRRTNEIMLLKNILN